MITRKKSSKQVFKDFHKFVANLTQYCLIQTSFSNKEEAEKIATILLDKKMAACVQISSPVTSYYHWKNALQMDQEYVLSIKTCFEKYVEIEEFINANHSYETPEIIMIILDKVGDKYKRWMASEVN